MVTANDPIGKTFESKTIPYVCASRCDDEIAGGSIQPAEPHGSSGAAVDVGVEKRNPPRSMLPIGRVRFSAGVSKEPKFSITNAWSGLAVHFANSCWMSKRKSALA